MNTCTYDSSNDNNDDDDDDGINNDDADTNGDYDNDDNDINNKIRMIRIMTPICCLPWNAKRYSFYGAALTWLQRECAAGIFFMASWQKENFDEQMGWD